MQEKSAHTLLGAFILVGLLIAVGLTLLVAGQGYDSRSAQKVVMIFDGSVFGLNKGAPVAIRGANIGQVTDIRVRLQEGNDVRLWMEVEAVIDGGAVEAISNQSGTMGPALVDAGLRAQLNNSSFLTGLLYVQLDFHPNTEAQQRAPDSDYFEIPTIPSPFDQLVMDFNTLNLPRLAADLQETAGAVRALTTGDAFQQIPESANQVLTSVNQVSEQLQALIARLEPQLAETLDSATSAADSTAEIARALEAQLPGLAEETRATLQQLNTTLAHFDDAAQNASQALEPDSPLLYNLNHTLSEIAKASRAINALSRSLEESPQSLLLGRPAEETP